MSASESCLCSSPTKHFQIVALKNKETSVFACGNDKQLATDLKTQDYEALGICRPPVMDQYYSISLRFPHNNTGKREICNQTHPYFWKALESQETQLCVNGLPLKLPESIVNNRYCYVASVLPGSLDHIYNGNWTRCMSVQYCIRSLEAVDNTIKRCANVSRTIPITTATTTTATATTTTTTFTTSAKASPSNNNTGIIVGSVFGIFAVILLLLLLHLFRKRNRTKRNASRNENQENISNE